MGPVAAHEGEQVNELPEEVVTVIIDALWDIYDSQCYRNSSGTALDALLSVVDPDDPRRGYIDEDYRFHPISTGDSTNVMHKNV